jgi:exosortase H (IPTLxxWG-CTERM-specific)
MAKNPGKRTPKAAVMAPPPDVPPTNGRAGMVRFLWLFPVCLAAGFALLWAPFTRPATDAFTTLLVKASAFLVSLFGGQAAAQQNVLRNPVTGFAITVEDTCNASNVVILLCAAVLAFPAHWRQKLKGLVAGTVVLYLVNFLRIISLFYLGQYNFTWFEFAHWYVWEGLMMLVTLVLFWVWVQNSRETA